MRTFLTASLASAGLAMAFLMPATPAAAIVESPDTFIEHAIQGDNAEIQLGRLAQQKGQSREVRDFGRQLANDHQQARTEALDVARSMRLRQPNQELMPEAQREYDRLQRLSGEEFDREFLRIMIQDHRQDVQNFQDEASARNGRVSRLAQNQLPTLQHHLDMAQSIRPSNDQDRGYSDRDRQDRGYTDRERNRY